MTSADAIIVQEQNLVSIARLVQPRVATPPLSRIALRVLLSVAGLAACSAAVADAADPTLQSGIFGDERLILAADADSNTLSGYYREGKCRVFFHGALRPVRQYQRPQLGESYEVQSCDPRKPAAVFTTTLYSRARGGFGDQITLEPGPDDAGRAATCSWRISLDRTAHVGIDLIAAAVVARPRPQLFELEQAGEALRLVPSGRAKLERDSGVWVTQTNGGAWSPPGMVRITWYDPPGTPHGGYVRTGDLCPLPSAAGTLAPALPCMTLNAAAFEQLGDCARRNPDSSYAVAAGALGQLDFDRWGLAALVIDGEGYTYVRRDGHALAVPTFDNAPDEFIGGLVRVRLGGKTGYADRRLTVVIPAIYDGAYRFDKDRARACIGCETVSDGEHSFYRGGTAVCLDRRGRRRDTAECGSASWLAPQLRE